MEKSMFEVPDVLSIELDLQDRESANLLQTFAFDQIGSSLLPGLLQEGPPALRML